MLEKVKERLGTFGYEVQETDMLLLLFSVEKAENTVKNECNISSVPDTLLNIAVDMAAGEFLTAKKTFAPDDIASLDLDAAVKQVQTGDTNVVFADGNQTDEQRLNGFLDYLLNCGKEQFSSYRRIKW